MIKCFECVVAIMFIIDIIFIILIFMIALFSLFLIFTIMSITAIMSIILIVWFAPNLPILVLQQIERATIALKVEAMGTDLPCARDGLPTSTRRDLLPKIQCLDSAIWSWMTMCEKELLLAPTRRFSVINNQNNVSRFKIIRIVANTMRRMVHIMRIIVTRQRSAASGNNESVPFDPVTM